MDTRHTGDHSRPVTPADVVACARSLLGVPYMHQGRTRAGIDCIGVPLMVGIWLELIPGIVGPTDYGRMPDAALKEHAALWMDQLSAPVAGATLILRWPKHAFASHCGIYTGAGTIIHAYSGAKKVIEHNYSGIWPRMLDSIWMLKGVAHE